MSQTPISIGEILAIHAEITAEYLEPCLAVRKKLRAAKLIQLLDEIIERRRKDTEDARAKTNQG